MFRSLYRISLFILIVFIAIVFSCALAFGKNSDTIKIFFKPNIALRTPTIGYEFTSGDDSYRIHWSETQLVAPDHIGHEVVEARNADFINATSYFSQTSLPVDFNGRLNGVYFYRVRTWYRTGSNFEYYSKWSDVAKITIDHQYTVGPNDAESNLYNGDDHATYLKFDAGTFDQQVIVRLTTVIDLDSEFEKIFDFSAIGETDFNKIIKKDITANFHYGNTPYEIFANNRMTASASSTVKYHVFFYDGVTWQPIVSTMDVVNEVVQTKINRFGRYAIRKANDSDNDIRGYAVPNPFTPRHSPFDVTSFIINNTNYNSQIKIKIYDINGSLIKTLEDTRTWDGTDNDGSIVSGGIYIYQIEVDNQILSGTIAVIR